MRNEAVSIATRRLLPLLGICYFINIVDRSNISIAALRMNPDIGLSTAAYGLGAGVFFISYFLFELPSNLFLNRFGARRWIFRIMLSWGIVSLLMAFVWNDWSFYAVRFLLGAAEAGFFPGVIFYFGQWFDRRSLTRVVGLFYAVIPIASALAAPISTLLLTVAGWRWLFVFEGVPAIVLAFVVLRRLPDGIEQAKWLSPDQKTDLRAGIAADGAVETHGRSGVVTALRDPQTILLAVQYFMLTLGQFAVSLWLPQVIGSFGVGTVGSGLLSAVPFALAAILIPLWALHSSRTDERYWHAILPIVAAAVVFTIGAFLPANPTLSITFLSIGVALSLMAASAYWSIPRILAIGAAAAASTAIANSLGNLAGFFGPTIAGFLVQATGSFHLVLALLGVPLVIAAVLSAITGRMGERERTARAAGVLQGVEPGPVPPEDSLTTRSNRK
ncbi:MFS transporter [Frondihabitans sucicola]|uniref:MFS transporter n=1 Tax=Frondihabitans sucicola TaxID=1268041 RepID=A0ABM8GHT0_9MICO|nr:MFS transporter [Frondihabitans sucicola]BDZ47901.1 MFS transporter [Frondihabitans sucicola]